MTGDRIVGIAGSVFRIFGDGWSKLTFLIAAFQSLLCLPLLLLTSGLCLMRFELHGRRKVEELVE